MAEVDLMEIPRRAPKLEWNLNTLIQIITPQCALGRGDLGGQESGHRGPAAWRQGHETLHKERLVDVKAIEGRNEARFSTIESEVRKIDNLDYRLTVAEQATATTATAMRELQDSLNDMNGDIRVMREIRQRSIM